MEMLVMVWYDLIQYGNLHTNDSVHSLMSFGDRSRQQAVLPWSLGLITSWGQQDKKGPEGA